MLIIGNRIAWETGVAIVERADARHIYVRCPHCGRSHVHGRALLGSRDVVAGCHGGFHRCRSYSIPDLGAPTARRPKAAA